MSLLLLKEQLPTHSIAFNYSPDGNLPEIFLAIPKYLAVSSNPVELNPNSFHLYPSFFNNFSTGLNT